MSEGPKDVKVVPAAQPKSEANTAAAVERPQIEPQPLITYPTYYTFKAMGLTGIRKRILELVEGVLGPIDEGSVSTRPSSAGKYESITVQVYLRTEDERRRVYEAFHSEKAIVWYV
ncbi:MAG: DUF493 domain-containing protein [Deltaproteobacteria bacterium]|nr:DUF493 domain-containing protein [Deltaproteobacteria bacterium]